MNKEKLIDMFTMKINGYTYRKIGEKYDTSKQDVHQKLSLVINPNRSLNYPKRPAVVAYMKENELTIKTFSDKIGINAQNLGTFLRGTNSIKTINAIIKYTGLTYEQIMSEKLKD